MDGRDQYGDVRRPLSIRGRLLLGDARIDSDSAGQSHSGKVTWPGSEEDLKVSISHWLKKDRLNGQFD